MYWPPTTETTFAGGFVPGMHSPYSPQRFHGSGGSARVPTRGGGYRGGRGRGGGRGGRGGFQSRIKRDDVEIPEHILRQVAEIAARGDSPEQVAAYKQARREKFPSKTNLEQKHKLEVEQKERGELAPPVPKRFGEQAYLKKQILLQREGLVQEQKEPSESTEEQVIKRRKLQKHCSFYLEGSCKKGAKCLYKHDPLVREKALKKLWYQPRQIGNLVVPKPAESLLAKLLESEIHQEQSLILQSFRFFMRNNFLQTLEKPKTEPKALSKIDEESLLKDPPAEEDDVQTQEQEPEIEDMDVSLEEGEWEE